MTDIGQLENDLRETIIRLEKFEKASNDFQTNISQNIADIRNLIANKPKTEVVEIYEPLGVIKRIEEHENWLGLLDKAIKDLRVKQAPPVNTAPINTAPSQGVTFKKNDLPKDTNFWSRIFGG